MSSVGTYLRAHPDVTRVATKGMQTATVVIKGQELDISADLGEGFSGRLIRTDDAAYMQMLGEEVAPGKLWDKITEEYDGMDLDAFLTAYEPMPMSQDTEDEYAAVRSGDRAARERLRRKLLDEFGARATYELWLDDQGRPVRHRLAAKAPMEIAFSHWDDTTVTAPPAAEVRVLTE